MVSYKDKYTLTIWPSRQRGWISVTLCPLKEASPQRLHSVIPLTWRSGKDKMIGTRNIPVVSRGQGCVRSRVKEFFGVMELFYIWLCPDSDGVYTIHAKTHRMCTSRKSLILYVIFKILFKNYKFSWSKWTVLDILVIAYLLTRSALSNRNIWGDGNVLNVLCPIWWLQHTFRYCTLKIEGLKF